MSRVVLVIPCYNEAERLDTAHISSFRMPGRDLRILLVDDGSRDATLSILETMRCASPSTIEVLALSRNSGKPEAVRQGFLRAFQMQPDFIGFWDADLATPLEELALFCEVLEARPQVDMVFGARVKLLGRNIERKALRHYFGRCFATAVSQALSLGVYDTQCGAKLFRVNEGLRSEFNEPFWTRWIFDVEILARGMGYYAGRGEDISAKIVEMPLSRWKDVSGSKVRFTAGLRAFWDLFKIWWRQIRPLRKVTRPVS